MKVFVYDRRDSKLIEKIEQVETVWTNRVARQVHFVDYSGIEYVYSTKDVKSTAYQN